MASHILPSQLSYGVFISSIHNETVPAITDPKCIKFQNHQPRTDLNALFGLSPSTAVIVQPATISLLIRKLFLYLCQTSSPDQPPLIEANWTGHGLTNEIAIQFQIVLKHIHLYFYAWQSDKNESLFTKKWMSFLTNILISKYPLFSVILAKYSQNLLVFVFSHLWQKVAPNQNKGIE